MVNHNRATLWQVAIDPNRCIGAGTCLALAPQLFRRGAGDIAEAYAAEVPAEPAALDSAACCPSQAITITDAGTGTLLHPRQ